MTPGHPTIDLVVTTIFEPAWMAGYLEDLRRFGRSDDVTIRIIADRKTPGSVWAAAAGARANGFNVECSSLGEQEDYLSSLGLPADFIPWNSDNRRNIGFLQAWQHGADVVISIDDDNYCRPDSDFFTSHLVVGHRPSDLTEPATVAAGQWFNICTLLEIDCGSTVYPRGFPYDARREAIQDAAAEASTDAPIAINAGLWLQDPDVDAVTRLSLGPRATAAKSGAILLEAPTWTPINTQNTAIARAALPAYYYVRMGFPLHGTTIDRYGDVLSGYFVQKCAKHLGQLVRVGSPVADHIRTPHNLLNDLYHELAGMFVLEDLVPWLQELQLSGSTYPEAYASLADALLSQARQFHGVIWDQGGREFLLETATCMTQWVETLHKIDAV